jgi:hypothetical protein
MNYYGFIHAGILVAGLLANVAVVVEAQEAPSKSGVQPPKGWILRDNEKGSVPGPDLKPPPVGVAGPDMKPPASVPGPDVKPPRPPVPPTLPPGGIQK